MRIEKDPEEVAMKGDDARTADQEVGADHLADVVRNAGENHEPGKADVGEAEIDMIGVAETEFRDIEDSIVARGGLTLISDLWYNKLGMRFKVFIKLYSCCLLIYCIFYF